MLLAVLSKAKTLYSLQKTSIADIQSFQSFLFVQKNRVSFLKKYSSVLKAANSFSHTKIKAF